MAEAGIFAPDERVELIDGELVEMPPLGLRHWERHATLNEYLVTMLGSRALVVSHTSVAFDRGRSCVCTGRSAYANICSRTYNIIG